MRAAEAILGVAGLMFGLAGVACLVLALTVNPTWAAPTFLGLVLAWRLLREADRERGRP